MIAIGNVSHTTAIHNPSNGAVERPTRSIHSIQPIWLIPLRTAATSIQHAITPRSPGRTCHVKPPVKDINPHGYESIPHLSLIMKRIERHTHTRLPTVIPAAFAHRTLVIPNATLPQKPTATATYNTVMGSTPYEAVRRP